MKAMIFAAGLGTRLRPLTNTKPKALVEINGMTLLEITIRRLKYFGCKEVMINIHHFGELILEFLKSKKNFGIDIHISDERTLLLDTGGGIKKVARFFCEEPFIIHNVDIISDIDLTSFYEAHLKTDALASLAVRHRKSSRYLLFNQSNILCGWRNTRTDEVKHCRDEFNLTDYAFSGIHVVNPELLDHLPDKKVFSIIDVYLNVGQKKKIMAFPHDENKWLDVGKRKAVNQARELLPDIPLDES